MRTPLLLAVLLAAFLPAPSPAQAGGGAAAFPEATTAGDGGPRWQPLFARRGLSCGVYRLAAGARDEQQPHARDEVYYVTAGRAVLEVGEQRFAAAADSVLFVPAGAEHRFVEITADLTAVVFFSHAKATRGGMAAGPRPVEQTPYDEASARGSARVFYWFRDSSAGQIDIGYGRPAWQEAFEGFWTEPSTRRWRFGENFWTTLDTNIPLTVGGTRLDVGQYYLVLQNHPEHGPRLLALDPQPIRERRLDAYEADETEGGLAIPLEHAASDSVANRLDVTLRVLRDAEADRAELAIRFGPHRLTAPVVLHP